MPLMHQGTLLSAYRLFDQLLELLKRLFRNIYFIREGLLVAQHDCLAKDMDMIDVIHVDDATLSYPHEPPCLLLHAQLQGLLHSGKIHGYDSLKAIDHNNVCIVSIRFETDDGRSVNS